MVACGDDTSASGSGGGGGGSTTATTGMSSGSTTTAASTTTTGTTTTTGAAATTTAATTGSGGDGGTSGEGGAGGAGGGETVVELPDVFDVVQAVAAEYPQLLEINTYESCGELVQRVLMALAEDPEWGHVAKTAGESQYTPPGFEPRDVDGHLITGFSQDAIFHRAAYRQVDIIANSSANSDPDRSIHGPATITWQVIEPEFYRPNNPWMATVPLP